jgi:protein SCO1/2
VKNRPSDSRRHRSGMTVTRAVLGAILWCAVIICCVLMWNRDDHEQPGAEQSDGSGDTVQSVSADQTSDEADSQPRQSVNISFPAKKIPEFTLQECMGEKFGLADLKGKPWVASFVFTRCVTTCPQITLAMKNLHDRLAEKHPEVMLVTMTVDSDHDTAEILQRYSETFEPDRDRWKFLTGDMAAMHEMIVEGFGIYVKENIGKARRPGLEVAHSNRVVLVNPDGVPVGTFLGTNPDDMAKLAGILSGRKPFPDPGPPIQFSSASGGLDIQLVPVDSEKSADLEGTGSEGEDAGSDAESDATTTEPITAAGEQASIPSVNERLASIDRLLPNWAKALPTANALLNSTSAILLTLGWLAIRKGNQTRHRNLMVSAFVVSVAFLGCYLTSHWALGNYTPERHRPFAGGSTARIVYYVILWPHVALAATVPFFAIRVFQHAAAERWDKHRRLARIAFPVWMYVSVTGVVIYGMLYHWPQTA